MPSGADLFVVCKKCGSEVSPYITECPYCGHRLRRRAPKLPRERGSRSIGGKLLRRASLGRMRRGEIEGVRVDAPPYATTALVAGACGLWIAGEGGYVNLAKLMVIGPLHGEWWRLLTNQFVYGRGFSSGLFMFATLFAVALFGWLLERRHGPVLVVALFFAAGVAGALAAEAAYPVAVVSGASAGALALLGAWVGPDLRAARLGEYYEGDLLGTAAMAAVLLALPFVRPEASWLAGVTGGALGLTLGLGLSRTRAL
ncbi:MAG: rhomboid family intramembrane serine protease [Solirubrobacteraceae bacterium]